jgi:hypothetical protein
MWSALLRGLLMMPSKGRFWDERSGVIKDVQSVGWDIWAINGALTPCPDCVDNPVTNEPSETDSLQGCYFMECLDEIGECDMANGPCLPVKIENGKLYYWNCCEWQEVGDVGGNVTTEGPTIDDAPYTEETDEILQCRKAYAIAKFAEALFSTMQDASDMDPFTGIPYIANQMSYVDWSWTDRFAMWSEWVAFDEIIPGFTLDWSTTNTEVLVCKLLGKLNTYEQGVTEEEFSLIKSSVLSMFGYVYEGLVKDTIDRSERKRWSNVVKLGLWDNEAVCNCAEGEYDAETAEVYFTSFVENTATQYFTVSSSRILGGRKAIVTVECIQPASFNSLEIHLGIDTSGPLSTLTTRVTGCPPHENYQTSEECAVWDDVDAGQTNTANETVERTNGTSYGQSKITYSQSQVPSQYGWFFGNEARMAGDGAEIGDKWTFTIEIVSYER